MRRRCCDTLGRGHWQGRWLRQRLRQRLGAGLLAMLAAMAAVAALAGTPGTGASPAGAPRLHVPSPDWRDQVLYFLMVDRFDDADARNNDQGAGEYKPGSEAHYNGGDLRGVKRRLDYIQGLGATAVWITPPVANQWVNPSGNYTGYHGYWAQHFKQVDAHLGSLRDYQDLSRALHARGMYLVQDIVLNHTGDYFYYGPQAQTLNPTPDPTRDYHPHVGTPPVRAPSQAPFHLNDPRRAADRAAAIYHWTPDVKDYGDRHQELHYQMSGLDDLNTENPVVRRALRDSYAYWIREVGVDAFRLDTAFYVPQDFLVDFMQAKDAKAPGMAHVARQTGRKDFFVFGEGFGFDAPYQDSRARKIESYVTGPNGQPVLNGMLNFPLYGTLGDVFARAQPTAELAHRIQSMMQVHARPHLMPSFVDNHDVDRFLAGGSVAGLKQALLSIFTLPGIPTLYYGTEQGFSVQRAAMFAAGHASGGRDRFDTQSDLYKTVASLAALRKGHRVFSRGVPTVLASNATGPGAIAWRMEHGADKVLVVLNSAPHDTLLDGLTTGCASGTVMRGLWSLEGPAPEPVTGLGGVVHLTLPARSAFVWQCTAQAAAAAAHRSALTIDPAPAVVEDDFDLQGMAAPGQRLQLVVDGHLAQATSVEADAQGRWRARITTSAMVDPTLAHRVVAWAKEQQQASSAVTFRVRRTWTTAVDHEDPAGDDAGPAGHYVYPTDPSWGVHRQMDLRRVKVSTAGGAMRVNLTMHQLTTVWNPKHGFDHVVFTVFIELPQAQGGATVMPLQNGRLPEGMRWHRRLRVGGWSNALFGAEGASPTHEGTPLGQGAHLSVDPATHTVRLTLSAAALGGLGSLSGARVYVTTWDYDAGYRALEREAGPHTLGGRRSAQDPLVMDDTPVLRLP